MYIVYAIGDKGKGYIQEIGRYEVVEELEIRIEMFSDDVVIKIDKENDEDV
ncbi:MAG: hypothetical protein ABII72_05015 [Parcubacteria group bacterium]